MKAKLVSVTEPEGKPIWFRTYEFECIDCGKHFTRHRFDSRTNPYCADCHRKHENERQRERLETKKQMAINDVLEKIRAEIKERCDRIDDIARANIYQYAPHREIQELLCEILASIDNAESEDK